MTSPQKIAAAREDLEDRTDGPVTAFVLMARACDLSADGRHDPEALQMLCTIPYSISANP